jgi:hypothetical protein
MWKGLLLNSIILFLPLISLAQTSQLIIEADTQVNCFDFNPDFYLHDNILNNPGEFYSVGFDLNNDSAADLKFSVYAYSAPMSPTIGSAELSIMDSNIQVACDTEFYAWPDTLEAGDSLGNNIPGNVWTSLQEWPQYPFDLFYQVNGNGGTGQTGLWQHPLVHYMGFRFINISDTLYGYFELKVNVISGYAEIWIDKVCYQGEISMTTGINISPAETFDFNIFPNPVQTNLNITTSSTRECVGILSDISARKLCSFSFERNHKVDVSFLPSGLYFLVVSNKQDKQIGIYKIVKE